MVSKYKHLIIIGVIIVIVSIVVVAGLKNRPSFDDYVVPPSYDDSDILEIVNRIDDEASVSEWRYDKDIFTDSSELSDSLQLFEMTDEFGFQVVNSVLTQYCRDTGNQIKTFDIDMTLIVDSDGDFGYYVTDGTTTMFVAYYYEFDVLNGYIKEIK